MTSYRLRRSVHLFHVLSLACLLLLSRGARAEQTPLAMALPNVPAGTVDRGALPAGKGVDATLYLAPSAARQAALDAFLAQLYQASSPSYHQWLTPAQFGAQFGPEAAQIAAVRSFIEGQDMRVTGVSASGLSLTVHGTATQMEAAFAPALHTFTSAGATAQANTAVPAIPAALATTVKSIGGFDTVSAPSTTLLVDGSASAPGDLLSGFAAALEANTARVLALTTSGCAESIAAADATTFALLAKQAAAQGTTVLAATACADGGTASFPSTLAEATSVAIAPGLTQPVAASLTGQRPSWQIALGLPQNGLRSAPDLTVSSLSALAQTVQTMVAALPANADGTPGRLGNLNILLYGFASRKDLFTQPDGATPGTWEPATGLGVVSLDALGKIHANGIYSTNVSVSSSNYSPTHGTAITLSSTVTDTSGKTNGAAATGSVTFTDSKGNVLGTGSAMLVNGTASVTVNNLPGGPITVTANYSGDTNYAPNTSNAITFTIQPEAATFTATATGSTQLGGNIPVVVTLVSASGIGTPAGTVSATLQGASGATTQTATLSGSNGTATATILVPALKAGSVTINVTCSPTDPSFTCYPTLTPTATVTPGTSTTLLSVNPYPVGTGSETFTATVTGAASPAPVPTGSVQFFDNGNAVGSGQLSNGTATYTASSLTVATSHTLTATYSGDSNYATSTSNGVNGGATLATTTTTLTLNPTSPVSGTTTTLMATVANAGAAATPTGTVLFYEDGGLIGSMALNGGVATFTSTTISGTTAHTFYAVYQGDTLNNTSQSTTITSTAGTAGAVATSTTVSLATTTPTQGVATSITATVAVTGAAKTAAPTGTVNFYSSTQGLLGSAALTGTTATISATFTVAGGQTVYATYAGDTNYAASTSASVAVTVGTTAATATTTTVSVSSATPTVGIPLTLSATVASQVAGKTTSPTGTVNFYSSTQGLIGSAVLNGSTATLTATLTVAGAQNIYATYVGDTNYSASNSVNVPITVAAGTTTSTTTTVTAATTTPTANVATTLTATVASTVAGKTTTPTGSVNFYSSTQGLLGTAALNGTTATLPVTFTTAGAQNIYATYVGDTNYSSSTSANTAITVTAAATTSTTTTVTLATTTPTVGVATSISAQVASTVAGKTTNPTGSVNFYSSTQGLLGTATITGTTATLPVTFTTAGAQNIYATYVGDANYSSSTSANTAITVAAATTTGPTQSIVTSPASPIPYSSPVVVTVGLTGITLTSGAAPAGTETLTVTPAGAIVNSSVAIVATTATSGTATFSFTAPAPGTYTLTATCTGTNFTCSTTGVTTTIVVVKGGTTTTVTANPTSAAAGQLTTLTATIAPVSPSTGMNFTGLVTFYNNGVSLGTGTVTGTTASFATTLNSTTGNTITAVYSGDTNWNSSTSTALSLVTPTNVTTGTLTASLTRALYTTNIILTANVAVTPTTGSAPTTAYGTVTFYDLFNGQQSTLGTGSLVSSGAYLSVAQLSTTGLLPGTHTITAIYPSSTSFAGVTTSAVVVNITDYGLSFNPSTLTIKQGSTASTTLTVNAINGFTGTVVLGCTPPSGTGTQCTFNPAVLSANGTSTLTITTTAPQAHATAVAGLRYTGLGVSVAALLGCLFMPKRRRPALLALIAMFGLLGAVGCTNIRDTGGSTVTTGGTTGTPLGTEIFTITTSGTDGVTTNRHDLQFQVTVQ